jgi:hypothetical protein
MPAKFSGFQHMTPEFPGGLAPELAEQEFPSAVAAGLLDSAVRGLTDYCSREETRLRLEAQVVRPAVRYLADRFAWGVRLFQAVGVLVLVQTLLLCWLLVRELRRGRA